MRRAAEQQPLARRGWNPGGRQILLAEMGAVGAGGERQIEAVVHEEERAGARRERADLRGPGEQLAVERVLGAQLHDRGAGGAGGARLRDGGVRPARRGVGEHVQTRQALRGRAPRQCRPGRGMPSSTIFLRSVLRLMPRMAAARIWLPSVRASTASSSGFSTRSRIRR